MKSLLKNVGLLFFAFTLSSCGEEEDLVASIVADSVEMGISSVSGAMDEQANNSVSQLSPKYPVLKQLLNPLPRAYAASCTRAVQAICSSGEKQVSYGGCNIGGSSRTLEGSVSLQYSDASCMFDTNGQTVTRTYDFTRTTGYGASIQTSSDVKSDYEGNSYGGGATLTKTATGFDLVISGKHKVRTSTQGRSRLDISVRTGSPVGISGGLERSSRVLNGGSIEMAHNLARFKVSLVPTNIQYSSSCCYPVSGTMGLTYSGTFSGTGSVTFNSCGNATVTRGEETFPISFDSCE